MDMYSIIHKKRLGEELSEEEIKFFVDGYTKGDIPDYQASALAMAIMFVGMTDGETALLTKHMALSGDTVDLSGFGNLSCDKHSSGGVGDKTTLIVAPIVASLGGIVAKMSGRGLGHTGGTVDKLESIPGYRTELTPVEFMETAKKTGLCVVGQSGNLAPCDKKLYALRDVTATVDSIPLIVSSIMSKKLAAGSKNIMLDVKCGSGAFMKTEEDAFLLAKGMVEIGKRNGRNVSALVTNMDVPLGFAIGNSLEVIEAVKVLKGEIKGDILEVCLCLASGLVSALKGITNDEAKKLCSEAVSSGKAFEKFKEWISAQGGDAAYIDNTDLFPKAALKKEITAKKDGYIYSMNAEQIGYASCLSGAGRKTKADIIDLSAGIVLLKKTGDYVRCGDVIAYIHASSEDKAQSAASAFDCSYEIKADKPLEKPLIMGEFN